jgi:hypothetical protein
MKVGGNCIMRSFITCILRQVHVLPQPPGKNPFAVKINNNNNPLHTIFEIVTIYEK